MVTSDSSSRSAAREDGFTLIEMMVAVTILMVVCGIVMRGVLGLTDVSRMVSNRTDMHNGVRNATELLTQEIGQAGRVSLPGRVTLTADALKGTNVLTVTSTAADANTAATAGMFQNEVLLVGSDNTQEAVVISAAAGNQVTLVDPLDKDHIGAVPVQVVGGFSEGVIPPLAQGYVNGSTGTTLKIFGDIHDDGKMVYVEYVCDFASGRLYRNSMAYNVAAKVAPTVEQVLIDNIEQNPVDPNTGAPTPCFTYQTQPVVGKLFVVDVAVTLTIHSQARDKNTADFQRETKALLNVSPRNVFNVWQAASLGMDERVQPTPAAVTQILADIPLGQY